MSYVAALSCDHVVTFKKLTPQEGDDDYKCPICKTWQFVLHVWKDQWHSKCTVCNYGRSHGMARKYAEAGAAQHYARTGHRTVIQFYNDAPSGIKKRAVTQFGLPQQSSQPSLFDEPPPF